MEVGGIGAGACGAGGGGGSVVWLWLSDGGCDFVVLVEGGGSVLRVVVVQWW